MQKITAKLTLSDHSANINNNTKYTHMQEKSQQHYVTV